MRLRRVGSAIPDPHGATSDGATPTGRPPTGEPPTGGPVGAGAAGRNAGNGGLLGAGVASGKNSGTRSLLGASARSGKNTARGGLVGAGVGSGGNSGTGGLVGAGVAVAQQQRHRQSRWRRRLLGQQPRRHLGAEYREGRPDRCPHRLRQEQRRRQPAASRAAGHSPGAEQHRDRHPRHLYPRQCGGHRPGVEQRPASTAGAAVSRSGNSVGHGAAVGGAPRRPARWARRRARPRVPPARWLPTPAPAVLQARRVVPRVPRAA